MKKLLLSSVAFGALAMAPVAANAQVDLGIGGVFMGYGAVVEQDEDVAVEANTFDFIRHTEIWLNGETTLDNGLTVGAHIEGAADGQDAFAIDESYVYFSGSFGRVNFGDEDGAAYLLQVAAPSADSNIDGIRQYLQPVSYAAFGATNLTAAVVAAGAGGAVAGIDYDHDVTRGADKLTYLTPVLNGFQVGMSYTPDAGNAAAIAGARANGVGGAAGASWETALRWEGEYNGVGITAGAGFSETALERRAAAATVTGTQLSDREAWNAGVDLDMGAFGLGVVYTEDDFGDVKAATGIVGEEEVIVVGADYTTGAMKFGASYYDSENTLGVNGVETQRYTGGVVYSYAPGISFRGSLSFIDHRGLAGLATGASADATSLVVGTNIDF